MSHNLVIDLLKATSQNKDIYPLLEQNLDSLNNELALSLREFAIQQFTKEPAKAVNIARVIVRFSHHVQQFQLGEVASKLEIALAGYETALTVITHENLPHEWGSIQKNLVNIYQQRQKLLFTTISELKDNTVKTQTQINNLTVQFEQEIQLAQQNVNIGLTQLARTETEEPLTVLEPIVAAIKDIKVPSQRFNTAILYDIENLTRGSSNPKFDFSLSDIIQKIKQYNFVNKITLQYAYADWSDHRLRRIRTEIQQLGIEPIQIFGFNSHSNAADIQLVIDTIELIYNKPSLEVFAIVSGDGGFSSLVKKLHEHGKIVIGCGYENQTNNILAVVCDDFIKIPETPPRNGTPNFIRPTAKVEPQTVLEYLKTHDPYCSQLKTDGIDLAVLRPIFTEKIPEFNLIMQKFPTFKRFLNSIIADTDLETVFRNGDKTKTLLRLKRNFDNSNIPYLAAS